MSGSSHRARAGEQGYPTSLIAVLPLLPPFPVSLPVSRTTMYLVAARKQIDGQAG